MSYLLTEPTAVLAVGGSDDAVGRVRSVVTAGSATGVTAVESVNDALAALDTRDDIGCVVVLGPVESSPADSTPTESSPADSTPIEAVRRIHEGHERVPVIVHAPESDCDPVALAAERDCVYLPTSVDAERLRAAVDDAFDTFDQRRREQAESSLFTTLLEGGELSIFAKDEEGRHVYKSDIENDVDPSEVIGKTDLDTASPGTEERAREALADDLRVVETGDPVYKKVEEYQYGDHEHWSQTTKVPWYDEDGDVQGLIGFAEDVTQRKIYQRRIREQADRVDQFISYITHDLRTPLQIAYGSLDRARRGDEAALDKVEEAIERIESIVDDLNNLSKGDDTGEMESGTLQKLRANSITSEFVPLVEEVWSVIAPDEADLVVEMPESTVVGTEAKTLRPALENLLKNAVDHAGPDVTVWVGQTDDNGFFVADDGPGIPEADRGKVLESGYTTAESGTGTGLEIVAETAAQEGWNLAVTESRTGGARFELDDMPMVTNPAVDVRSADRIAIDGNRDVGPVDVAGSATHDAEADEWTVVGDGTNIWNDIHEFHLAHGSGRAPVRIEGRVADLDGIEEYSKAGFTVRAGLDEQDPFGYVGVTESHGSEMTWRENEDGFTDSDQFEELPGTFPWYRVEYVDGEVACALSPDGETWRYVDQRSIDLGEDVVVGLVVCSHSDNRTCEATFADVRAYELDVE